MKKMGSKFLGVKLERGLTSSKKSGSAQKKHLTKEGKHERRLKTAVPENAAKKKASGKKMRTPTKREGF